MSEKPAIECVVFGAGALGLGFLGPELGRDCRLTYVDIPPKADLIAHLACERSYAFNRTGPAVHSLSVQVGGGLWKEPGSVTDEALAALAGADLVFTVVGEPHLAELGPVLAGAAGARSPGRPLRVLCGENGLGIAEKLRAAVEREAAEHLGNRLIVADTMMGRAAKVVADPEPPLRPVAPGLDWAVLADPFFGIHAEQHALEGLAAVPQAVEGHPPERFRALEEAKLLTHNGLHCVLACWGRLRGRGSLHELTSEPEAMALGRRLLYGEAAPALLGKHGGALNRSVYLNYCDFVFRRVTCPVFRDSVARGTRGIMRKLKPWERLVHGVRTVAAEGIEPRAFAAGLAMAVAVARRSGETDLGFDEVLTRHCRLDPEQDAHLIELIHSQRDALPTE